MLSFCSCGYLDVSVPRVRSARPMRSGGSHCRSSGVSPFGNLWINARLPAPQSLSQAAASFVASRCPDIHRTPLRAWPRLPTTVAPGRGTTRDGGGTREGTTPGPVRRRTIITLRRKRCSTTPHPGKTRPRPAAVGTAASLSGGASRTGTGGLTSAPPDRTLKPLLSHTRDSFTCQRARARQPSPAAAPESVPATMHRGHRYQ